VIDVADLILPRQEILAEPGHCLRRPQGARYWSFVSVNRNQLNSPFPELRIAAEGISESRSAAESDAPMNAIARGIALYLPKVLGNLTPLRVSTSLSASVVSEEIANAILKKMSDSSI